jgi:hypothetical protein
MSCILETLDHYLAEQLRYHRENLRLWEAGFLTPTAEDELEIETTKSGLRGAIYVLVELQKFLEIFPCP